MSVAEPLPFGARLPELRVPPPGPASRELARRLRAVESRNVTHIADGWPVFWEAAAGANVRDADGNVYVDLSSGFGVALLGHSHAAVLDAIRGQAGLLAHGMGDVHPTALKVALLERLQALSPWPDGRAVLASTGSEAVEIALKTALLATDRPGLLAFEGGYHGLTLGSLAVTSRELFRGLFEQRLYRGVAFAPFPEPWRGADPDGDESLERVAELLGSGAPNGDSIGAIVVEPVQGRAGVRIPPEGFMQRLSDLAADAGAILIADEVQTGMGRCGSVFASERVGLLPDLICVGKALGAGMPVSACLGRGAVMDAWPESEGEAIHTSTFLGHPLSCAAALAALEAHEAEGIPARAGEFGERLVSGLRERLDGVPTVGDVRGLGLLIGVELVEQDGTTPARAAGARVASRALERGVLVLPAGDEGHVVELTPSVVLTETQASQALDALAVAIGETR